MVITDGFFTLTPSYSIYYDIYDIILNNPKFISKINYFGLCSSNYGSLKAAFLSSLPLSIRHIDLLSNNIETEEYFVKNVIQLQQQLSSITIRYPKGFLLFDSLKYHSNTLTSISFDSCKFSNNLGLDSLSYLTQLESLQFKHCIGLNLKVIQPYLTLPPH
jgi:hypothetical protein